MAAFCLRTGISPSEYKKLTLGEYQAFIEQIESIDNG
jgi:hypothetical protein